MRIPDVGTLAHMMSLTVVLHDSTSDLTVVQCRKLIEQLFRCLEFAGIDPYETSCR